MFIRSFHCKMTVPLCKQVVKRSRRSWDSSNGVETGEAPPAREGGSYTNYFRLFISFPYVFIYFNYLYHYGLLQIYFMTVLQSSRTSFILLSSWFQCWPQGALSVVSCVPLTRLQPWGTFFWRTSLLSNTARCSGLILYFLCPFLQWAHVPFIWE